MSVKDGIKFLKAIADANGYRLRLEPVTYCPSLQNNSHVHLEAFEECCKCHVDDKHIVIYYSKDIELLWILGHEIGHIETSCNKTKLVQSEYNASEWALSRLSDYVSLPELRRGADFLQEFLQSYITYNDYDAEGHKVANREHNLPSVVKQLELHENSKKEVLK